MIPIFLILAIVNAILSLLIALRLYYADRFHSQPSRKRLYLFYATFAFAWVSWSLAYAPRSLTAKSVFDLGGYLLLTLAIAELVQIPFLLKGRLHAGALFRNMALGLGAAYVIGRIIDFRPVYAMSYGPFYMWAPERVVWLDIVLSLAIVASAAIMTYTFYSSGRRAANAQVTQRSLRLTLSRFIYLSAVFIALLLLPHTLLAYAAAALLVAANLLITIFALTLPVTDPSSLLNTSSGDVQNNPVT